MLRDRDEVVNLTVWDDDYTQLWTEELGGLADAAERAGWRVFGATAFSSPERLDDFRHAVQWAHPLYTADDILLKTIVRSNPGVVVFHDGVVVAKFHHRHLPADFETLLRDVQQPVELAAQTND